MSWTHFPLSVGRNVTEEVIWQELIDAINERCLWAGQSTLPSPVVGDNWFTGSQVVRMQNKVQSLVPHFTDPSPAISGSSVIFSNWTWDTYMAWKAASHIAFVRYFFAGTGRWHRIGPNVFGKAAPGDIGSVYIATPQAGTLNLFLRQMYQIINDLRYTTKTVSWVGEQDPDFRWMSTRVNGAFPRLFTPPDNTFKELNEADAKSYVEDHWSSGGWTSVLTQDNVVNGPFYRVLGGAFTSYTSIHWGNNRWISNASGIPLASGEAEIELGRRRTNLVGDVVSGASSVFGFDVPYTYVADGDSVGAIVNRITTTGDAVQVQIAEGHASGTLVASGLGYDDATPVPTPDLDDISGDNTERYAETYHELNAEVLIELDFDKMT